MYNLIYVEIRNARPYLQNVLLTQPIFPFIGQIYAVIAPKNNEWGSDYWLVDYLEGKQTILEPITDDENIEFPTGSMVIKGDYLKLASQHKRTGGYAYQDYRPKAIVYHFTNLVVCINIKLRTLGHKNRSHVRYLVPHIEHKILMDAIGSKDDLDELLN